MARMPIEKITGPTRASSRATPCCALRAVSHGGQILGSVASVTAGSHILTSPPVEIRMRRQRIVPLRHRRAGRAPPAGLVIRCSSCSATPPGLVSRPRPLKCTVAAPPAVATHGRAFLARFLLDDLRGGRIRGGGIAGVGRIREAHHPARAARRQRAARGEVIHQAESTVAFRRTASARASGSPVEKRLPRGARLVLLIQRAMLGMPITSRSAAITTAIIISMSEKPRRCLRLVSTRCPFS